MFCYSTLKVTQNVTLFLSELMLLLHPYIKVIFHVENYVQNSKQ